jgi:hypothetical protein
MDCLGEKKMYMLKQGDLVSDKRMRELENRVEMLENLVKELQSAKVRGRPKKGENEPEPQSDS